MKIPAEHEAPLARLATMQEAEFSAFRTALTQCAPSISIDDLAMRVTRRAMLDENDDASGLIEVLVGMYVAIDQNEETIEEFVAEACEGARDADSDALKSIDNLGPLSARLIDLLSLHKPIGVSAKALDVITESAHLWCRGRVITDLRPVFIANSVDPAAVVVMHSLRITYHAGPATGTKSRYIDFETSDLLDLKKLIDRAIEKDKRLRAVADASALPSIPYEVREN